MAGLTGPGTDVPATAARLPPRIHSACLCGIANEVDGSTIEVDHPADGTDIAGPVTVLLHEQVRRKAPGDSSRQAIACLHALPSSLPALSRRQDRSASAACVAASAE